MSLPVTYSYYCSTASFAGTTFGALTRVAPPQTNTAIGWNTNRNNPPLYSELNWNAEVVRTDAQWLASPTQSAPNQNAGGSGTGNCFIFGPLRGEFFPGIWNITMSVKSTTAAASHTGQLHYRFWTSVTGSGANATLVTSSFLSSSIGTIASNTVPVFMTASFTLPQIILRNSYVLVQTYWSIITSPGGGTGNNNVDNNFVFGTGSIVKTSPFISDHPQFMRCIDD